MRSSRLVGLCDRPSRALAWRSTSSSRCSWSRVVVVVGLAVAGADPSLVTSWPIWARRQVEPTAGLTVTVLLALALATIVAYWWPRRRRRRSTELAVGVSPSLATFALALPYYLLARDDQAGWWSALTSTLALYLGGAPDAAVAIRPGRPGEVVHSTEGPATVADREHVVVDGEGRTWVIDDDRIRSSYERCDPVSG